MELSLFDKIKDIFKYIFSSFFGIELLLISLLLLVILIINIRKDNKIYKIIFSVLLVFSYLVLLIASYEYTYYSVTEFFRRVMEYIYFPSTIVYFFLMFFVVILLLFTIITKKMSKFKKIFNYIIFITMIFLYILFVILAVNNSIDLSDKVSLYKIDTILSVVQVSNFVLLIWFVVTCFYYLYLYFKKKYD